MNKILVLGASNSSKSINRKLANYAARQMQDAELTSLDLNDFEMPIYSIDREKANGIPAPAYAFKKYIEQAGGIVISFAEHNGGFTAAFKNLLDWVSRIEKSIWLDKPMFLLATSPGGRGGKTVLENAKSRFGYMGGRVSCIFSLPSFNQNFAEDEGITDAALKTEFDHQLSIFESEFDLATLAS